MTRNRFGGTPLKQAKTKFVMESATAELYADTWNSTMSKKDKQDIAKKLNIKIDDKAFDKDFADFDGNQADMVMDIVSHWLSVNESMVDDILKDIDKKLNKEDVKANAQTFSNALKSISNEDLQKKLGDMYNKTIIEIAAGDESGIAKYCKWSSSKRKQLHDLLGIEFKPEQIDKIDESRPDFAQYQQLWKQMSTEDKQSIAKELKHDKFTQFDVDLSKLSNDDYDIADDIITVWLAKHQSLNESADIKLYQLAHQLNVDESWLKWIVGMVTLRFLWKKVTKKFKNKIMQIAGVPESLWSRFNNQDLDSLPIAYKDKVSHALTANYDGSVNESLNAELQQLFEYVNDYVNESANDIVTLFNKYFEKHGYESYQQMFAKGDIWFKDKNSTYGGLYHVKKENLSFVKDMWTIYSKGTYSTAITDSAGMPYQNDNMQTLEQVMSFVLKSFANYKNWKNFDMSKLVNESIEPNDAWQLLDNHFTKTVNESWDYLNVNENWNYSKDCPLNRAMDFVASATYAQNFKQPVQSKFGVKFEADFRTGNALKAFNELTESQQTEFLKMLGMVDESCVDELYEEDNKVYTNDGKESVIKKLDSGKYGITGKDGKLWDTQYDNLKEAAEALKAYHVNEANDTPIPVRVKVDIKIPDGTVIKAGESIISSEPAEKMSQGNDAADLYVIKAKNDKGKVVKTQAAKSQLEFDKQVDESIYKDRVTDPWNHWNPKTPAERKKLADAANVGVLDFTEDFINLPLTTQAKIAEYLDKQMKAGKLDESEDSHDNEVDDCDETKLEDAYHDFIDKKLKDWFDKKTVGELSNEEKKIFFGRLKRTWPKKKKELGFDNECADESTQLKLYVYNVKYEAATKIGKFPTKTNYKRGTVEIKSATEPTHNEIFRACNAKYTSSPIDYELIETKLI